MQGETALQYSGECRVSYRPNDAFDVVEDMAERHNLAAKYPHIVQRLLQRLQTYNNTHCGGLRCQPDNAGGPLGQPSTKGGPHGVPVWLPWRGNSNPEACDTDRDPAGQAQ